MNRRIDKAYLAIAQEGLDGLLVSAPANISYLTKTISRDSYLLLSPKQNIYFTDSRYIEEAKKSLNPSVVIKKINGSVFNLISGSCLELGLRKIGFEERHLPYAEYEALNKGLSKGACLAPVSALIEDIRQVKELQEIETIKKAIDITAAALKFIKDFICAGKKEIEVVAELERFIRYHGASDSAFDIIVASGPNSSFPHHIAGERKIKENEPVLIDIGVDYLGYKCDLTRVFFLGKIDILTSKVYNIVIEAQTKAFDLIGPGKAVSEIDSASRNHIRGEGFGDYFGHSLGHGVGLEVHEAPNISGRDPCVLEPGMVFTVEPAVYLPGKFGIRIEDMVLVTQEKSEVLSGFINK